MTNIKNPFGLGLVSENTTNECKEDEDKRKSIKLGNLQDNRSIRSLQDKTKNITETTLKEKFFKEVTILLPGKEKDTITKNSQVQEELKHLMEEVPQFKNAVTIETFKKMNDKDLNEFIEEYYS